MGGYIIHCLDYCDDSPKAVYTWEQLLEFFEAPIDLKGISELQDWIDRHRDIICQYKVIEL